MKEVFISYSTVDTANAETVRNVLETNGLSCWMAPRDIPGGSNYTREIPIAIRNCKVFVLVLSKNAQSSQWVLKELDSAVNCGKVILPFMLEDCILNDEFNFLLTGAQRYAAYQKTAEALETLVSRVRSIVDVPSAAAQTVNAEPVRMSAPVVVGACPACSGAEIKYLPSKVKRSGVKEMGTMLLIPVLAFLGAMIAIVIAAFTVPYDMFWLTTVLSLAGMVAGGLLGDHISKTIVRRNRVRRHAPNYCYRCKACGKVFLLDKKI